GVDIKPQPNYVGDDFIQADALDYLGEAIDRFYPFNLYDAIHASPPCQRWSTATKRNGTELQHPDLVGHVRSMLRMLDEEG
ncbi:DNA cytosine methyltransferase, partial [Acinetobacter baumannii]